MNVSPPGMVGCGEALSRPGGARRLPLEGISSGQDLGPSFMVFLGDGPIPS